MRAVFGSGKTCRDRCFIFLVRCLGSFVAVGGFVDIDELRPVLRPFCFVFTQELCFFGHVE